MTSPTPRTLAPLAVAATGLTCLLALGAPAAAATGSASGSGSPVSGGTASNPSCSPATLAAVRTTVGQELADRLTHLSTLSSRVSSASHLVSGDRAMLQQDLTAEQQGLGALQGALSSATSCAQVQADAREMVDAYRVYLVMTPQVDLTIVADDETALVGRLQGLEPLVETAIAQAGPTKAHAAQAAFSDLQTQVASASSAVGGLSSSVLALTPAGYPGNAPTITAAHSATERARTALHQAGSDLRSIVADLG